MASLNSAGGGGAKLESEVAVALDLNVIRYSKVWEDHRVLSQALDIQPGDVVLSITSCGDQVLNLLLDGPKKIVSVDMSPAQNAVLELKLAAIRHLGYDSFLVLLGETADSYQRRMEVYEEVKPHLPRYAQDYWISHPEPLGTGLSSSGRLERYLAGLNRDLAPDSEHVDAFFGARDLQEQAALFHQLATKDVEEKIGRYTSKEQQKRAGRSEAQLKYVELSDGSVTAYFWRRFCKTGLNVPAQDNFYLSWFCRGRRGFNPREKPGFAPPFMTESGFTKLKGLVDRVEVYNGTLENYLCQPHVEKANKGNFSDIFEYMDKAAADALFAALADHFAPGARLAYWNLLIPRAPPTHLMGRKLVHLKRLSEELHRKDRVFYWSSFNVFERI